MEKVNRNIAEITIDGKNVTGDISPMLSKLVYTDRVEAESDDLSITFEDTNALFQKPWYPQQGDSLAVKLGSSGDMLDCGVFEIDEIELEIAPDIVTIKAIGAAITKNLRTNNSKAFEKQSLKKIAQYFADKHGLKLTGNMNALGKIVIERKTQERQTDISFLASLAREYGFIFSVRGSQLVFMEADELESTTSVMTIDRKEMSKGRFLDKTSQIYAGAAVATRDIRTNSVKKWSIESSGDSASQDTLIVGGRVESEGQAQAMVKGALKKQNDDKVTGIFSVPGNVGLVAGINIDLTGIGNFSGKWIVVTSTHNVSGDSGYTTDIAVRRIIE